MADCGCNVVGGRRRRTQKVKKSRRKTMHRKGGKKASTVKGFTGKWNKLRHLH